MVLGLSLHAFTVLHVITCIVELFAGAVVVAQMLAGRRSGLNFLFLLTAVLTTITGFMFPYHGPTPAITLGFITLPLLLLAAVAWYTGRLRGVWRVIYIVSMVILFYLDAFVAVVQSFMKIPALHALAPTGKELPFAIVQGLVLLVFIVLGFLAVKRFRPTALVSGA
jgi:hypothetical protein